MHDFYFTGDDYRYRFELDAKRRFIQVLRERFNSGVAYKGRVMKWDTVIEQKTNELGRFLTRKSPSLDFMEPTQQLERQDTRELRAKILALSQSKAHKLGIGKSTLHYLRNNAATDYPFKVYNKVGMKLTRDV